MMRKLIFALAGLVVLSACTVTPGDRTLATPPNGGLDDAKVRSFLSVIDRVEPVAESECRARTSGMNCDFTIFVDDRPGQPPNAFQTLDRQGRPLVVFTIALLADARNEDELAFILGHEAAHHIAGHIPRQQRNAEAGALVFGTLTALAGGDATAIRQAAELGQQVGARTYSKDFELEADELGTIVTLRAGYDPLRGAAFFTRIPDPGDKFLGTHPPNAARIETVRSTVAGLQS